MGIHVSQGNRGKTELINPSVPAAVFARLPNERLNSELSDKPLKSEELRKDKLISVSCCYRGVVPVVNIPG
jgi:hypothetical protein